MRSSRWRSQASGATPLSLAVPIKPYIAAARSPPLSALAKRKLRQPRATLRSARSAASCRSRCGGRRHNEEANSKLARTWLCLY